MNEKNIHAQELGRLGGRAGRGTSKARKTTTEQARKAANARWNKALYRPMHSLTFLRQVEDAIWTRLSRKVLLDDISGIELEQLWFMAKDPLNANNEQLTKALNEILNID